MKKTAWKIVLLTTLVLFVALALAACGKDKPENAKNGTPPAYEGISLRGDATIARHRQAERLLSSGDSEEEDASSVKGDFFDESITFDPQTDPFESGTAPLEEKAADTLAVVGAASDIYYAEKNQDLYVVVRLSNPDSYEIQSFTLNGVKYANYMFEKGSDMENLILKVNVGDAAGIIEYTLDAVKYIDGTEIKDVRLDGEKTVRAGVQTDGQLTVAVGNPATTLHRVSFSVAIEDRYGLISNAEGYAKAILYDGETIYEKDLSLGENAVIFEGLAPNTAYQYAVVAYYDDLGGDGAALHTYAKKAVRTNAEILFKNVTVSKTSLVWDYYLDDECPDLTVSGLELYLDDVKVSEPEATAKIADGLFSGRSYTVVARYVGVDGSDETISFTVKTLPKQTPTLAINNVTATQTSVAFAVAVTAADQVGAISKVELLHGNDATIAEDLSVRSFENLLSNNDYSIRVTYTFDLNDGAGEQTLVKTKAVKTAAKQAPTVSVTDLLSSQTEISGSLSVSDPDGICSVDEVALYKGDDKVRSTDERSRLVFAGLQSGSTYRISVTFSYDLNDGDGVHATTRSVGYPTLVDSIAVDEMVLLNNNVVKHGEELNLRVYFVNPSEIEITAIYVNGQPVTVVGGDRIESAIVKFVPEKIGLIDFAVDRVDYTYQNFSVSQAVDSDVSVQYPIFGDLEISYTPVTSLFYDNSGDGVYLSFENEEGYTVYAVNGSANFVRFADGQYFTPASSVTSIEYGYENYGHTTQTCSYQTSAVVSVGKNYQKISTAEEFFAMTNGYYYLTDDLDLRNASLTQPIAFTGVLLGNGHKIRGLSNVIDTSKTDYYNVINSGWYSVGTFYDVSFTELYISVNATSDKRVTISPLGGARLVNCTVRGDIIGNQYVTVANLTGVQNSSTFNVNITLDGNMTTVKYTAEATLGKNAAVTIAENGAITCTLPNGKVYFFGTFQTDLTTFTLPDSVTSIGERAFYNCSGLTSITIPDSVTSIGNYAFYNCSKLSSVVWNATNCTSAASTDSPIFSGCSNLTTVTFGENVETIPASAFYGCSGLTGITIPDSVTSIGDYAFSGCSGLESIVSSNPDYPAVGNCLIDAKTETLIVGCKNSVIPTDGSVTSIGDCAFYNCSGLTGSLAIPDSVTSIGNGAFDGCKGLTSVTIGNGVTSIGSGAFFACYKLRGNLVIPDGVTSIGYDAFAINGLTSVTIPDSVTSIGDDAFYACSALSSITFTGTKAQWNAISKATSWDSSTNNYTIHCTDGDIAKS